MSRLAFGNFKNIHFDFVRGLVDCVGKLIVRHTGRSIWKIMSTFVSQLFLANFWVENLMAPADFL